jgi:hypothetical protein
LEDVFDMAVGLSSRFGVQLYDRCYPERERFFEANYVLIRNDAAFSVRFRECMLGAGNALVASHR